AGAFTQGQVGATYTLTVTNTGTGSSAGLVTVTDSLPAGLTATALAGAGRSCNLAPLTCSPTDAFAAGADYPAPTPPSPLAATAPGSLTPPATVAGGGELNTTNNTASDLTPITAVAPLTPPKPPAGAFTQGQVGATYTLTVTNTGTGSSAGLVTVTDTL